MPRLRFPFAFAAALSLVAMPAVSAAQEVGEAQQRAIEQAIHAVQGELRQAAGKLDADALFAWVLDTGMPPIIEDGLVHASRAAALANTAAGFRGLSAISYAYTREHLSVLSPTLVLAVGEGTAHATLTDGRQIEAPFAETILFALRDGAWKVLHAHRSAPSR